MSKFKSMCELEREMYSIFIKNDEPVKEVLALMIKITKARLVLGCSCITVYRGLRMGNREPCSGRSSYTGCIRVIIS